jgi:glycosyltransferase involved in cell wall biosynthesis
MKSKQVAVSVVIPAYNAAEFLAEALDSVLSQTYKPLEVIVVDDGSEDETPQVVSAYAGKVTYIRKPHGGGCGGTRNVGIQAASGEWIAFLDADDIWMPTLLERLVEGAVKTGADLVFCDFRSLTVGSVDSRSNLEHKGLKTRLANIAPKGALIDPFELLLEVGCYFCPSSVLVRRSSLLGVGLFDEGIYCTDDLDLWLRLALRHRFGVVSEALVLYRVHSQNMSRDGWVVLVNQIKTFEKLEGYAPAQARGSRWRRLLRKEMGPKLREQGACYLKRGELLMARESWAKSFQKSYSPIAGAYWVATFLPRSWIATLREWKRQSLLVFGYKY